MKAKVYKVDYTKKIGGVSSILVRAHDEEQALKNARFLCVTGSDFRNAREADEVYVKPMKQGFQGRH